MRNSGRLSAAIEILTQFQSRRVPVRTLIADWGRNNRYAGAKDRAWISGLCLDALRRRNSLAFAMGKDEPRELALGAMRYMWRIPLEELTDISAEEPHGPGALSDQEYDNLKASPGDAPAEHSPYIAGDFPEWMTPYIERVFGVNTASVMAVFAERADVDLRLNTLKAPPEKSLNALKLIKGDAIPILKTAARISAPDPSKRAPAVTIIPAFNKGWVEVQDLGSQIAAAAAGDINGQQVLDYCAGGGGKTLALAALMDNTGQLYAYDRDPRRLKPLYHRAKRAGVRNLQIRSTAGGEGVGDLSEKMDVVFVDAPCTGAGTWRRHPDTKWRLTEKQLQTRMDEQDIALKQASNFVKPGGSLIWVTCSFLMEENEDRLTAFLNSNKNFSMTPVQNAIEASGLLTEAGRTSLMSCVTEDAALRLTPDKIRADGFFIARLENER